VSWDEVGGVQPLRHKPLLSTQGHSFRLRSAATRKMLMAHTLNDLVIRACDEDEARLRGSTVDGLEALRAQTRFFEAEAAALRDTLATELARLALALARTYGRRYSTPRGGRRRLCVRYCAETLCLHHASCIPRPWFSAQCVSGAHTEHVRPAGTACA